MFHGGDGFELLFLAAIAFVVVGPKDFPILLRKFGQFMGKMRNMAAEFRASFDEMARQSELDELRKEVDAMRQSQIADQAARASGVDDINQALNQIGDDLHGVQFHPPMSHQYVGEMTAEATSPPDAPPPPVAEAPKPKAPRRVMVADAAKPVAAKPAAKPASAKAAKTKPAPKPRAASAKATSPAKAPATPEPAAKPAARRTAKARSTP